jgi:polar amino acid transport system substrate-binding protein
MSVCAGILAAGLSIVAIMWSTVALAEDSLEGLRKQGYVRIAIANEPPYTEVKANGHVTGASVEIPRAVFKKLGIPEVVATVTEFGAMIPGLQAGRFDVIAAALFIKPERCQAILYSQPDTCGAEGLMVKKGNPLSLESYEDIKAKPNAKVGVCGGCVGEKYARAAGIPNDRIIIVPDGLSGVKMVQSGRIDAYAVPSLSLTDLIRKTGATDVEVFEPIKNTTIACAGAGFRKSARELRDAYDKVLKDMKDSGEFTKIIEPFGLSAKAALITTREELCKGPN